MKLLASFVALTVALAAPFLDLQAAGNPMDAQPDVKRGVWCCDFAASKEYADRNNVPMLVLWANPGCSQCEKLEKACKEADFKAWQEKQQLVMVFGYGANTPDLKECKAFAKNSSKTFPYVAVYWKANAQGQEVLERFTGRSGKIGYGTSSKVSLQQQVMDAVDGILDGWDPSGGDDPDPDPDPVGGRFLLPDTESAHLEAIAGETAAVTVPLVRSEGVDTAAVNVLDVAGASYTVAWQPGESRKDVVVAVPEGVQASETVSLVLKFGDSVAGRGSIRIVDAPSNSTDNPAWIGETFDFGEWTMDLDAAKTKVSKASGDACTVVFFTGALWCPWCLGLENHVFAEEEFKAWARDNQVALVLLDNTKRSPQDATSAAPYAFSVDTDGAAPTLLRYEVGANGRSGAAYLSRKGIPRAEAERVLQRNHDLGYPGGTYCAPEALRTGYPTAIVLDKGGRIRGRFVYQADSSAGKDAEGAYRCDFSENMERFKALVAQAADDELSEDDKFASTTTRAYDFGTSASARLTINRGACVFKLNGVYGKRVTFAADGDSAGLGVSLSVIRLRSADIARKSASGATVGTLSIPLAETIATGVGTLSCDFPDDEDVYLKVASFSGSQTTFYAAAGSLETVVGFSSTGVPLDLENEYYGTSFQTVVPLAESGVAIGVIELKSTARNKVTAKYRNAETGKTVSFSGTWVAPNEYGVASFQKTKSGQTLSLTLAASGLLEARVGKLGGSVCVEKPDSAQYLGVYTVALPVSGGPEGKSLGSTGIGSLLLKANSASAKKYGKVAYQLTFPDGKKASGSTLLAAGEGGFANLTVYVRKGANALVLPLRIRPFADEAPTHRAVILQKDAQAVWRHAEKTLSFACECGAYGSVYDKSESLIDCCSASTLLAHFDVDSVADSEQHGQLVAVAGEGAEFAVSEKAIKQAVKDKALKLTFSRTYGLLTGRVQLSFADKKVLEGTISAITVPDWHDCGCFDDDDEVPLAADIPFVVGTCTFKDKLGGRTVYRGLAVTLKVKE